MFVDSKTVTKGENKMYSRWRYYILIIYFTAKFLEMNCLSNDNDEDIVCVILRGEIFSGFPRQG